MYSEADGRQFNPCVWVLWMSQNGGGGWSDQLQRMRSNSWLLLTASWAEYREALISGRSLSTISSCTDLIRGAKLGEPAPRGQSGPRTTAKMREPCAPGLEVNGALLKVVSSGARAIGHELEIRRRRSPSLAVRTRGGRRNQVDLGYPPRGPHEHGSAE